MKGTIWPRPFEKGTDKNGKPTRKPVKGSTWTYQFRSGGSFVTKGGFRTKGDAERALAEAMVAHEHGTARRVEPSKKPLADYLRDDWLPTLHYLKPSTRQNYANLVNMYVIPHLGDVRLSDVTTAHVASLYATLRRAPAGQGKPLAETSIHHVHVALSKALGNAVEAGLLKVNPVVALPKKGRPKQSPVKMKAWTGEELQRFLAAASDDRLYACFGLVAATGLRRGELCGLKWEDIDLDGGRLSVRANRVSVDYDVAEGTPKSTNARTVDLDPGAVAALRSWSIRQKEERLAWSEAWTDSGYVFTREDGTPIHPQTVTLRFKRLTKKAGVTPIRFHDLRHTHATIGLAQGVPVKVMQERLGHASAQITQDLYQHVIPGMQADAAALIGAVVWGGKAL